MTDPVTPLTHVYKNIRTGIERPFRFVATRQDGVWDLVTASGAVIGQWKKLYRMYYMRDGLSNHVILKTDDAVTDKGLRKWNS